MYVMTNINPDSGFWFFVHARMLTSVGLPLVFVPIMAASYDGIPPHKTDLASALLNAARNTGGSIGVSLASNVLAHRVPFPQTSLPSHASPSGIPLQGTMQQLLPLFAA